MNASTLFDFEAAQAIAVRYGTSLIKSTPVEGEADGEFWDVPLYLGEETGQRSDVFRIDVAWEPNGSWVVMPYVDHGRSYTSHEVEHIGETFRQSALLADELNAL